MSKLLLEGKQEWFKEKVELDDQNNKVTLIGQEGDVFKHYRSFKPVYHVVPKGEGSLAKLSIEYEKLDASVPPPNKYLNMMVNITKDIDAHFQKAWSIFDTYMCGEINKESIYIVRFCLVLELLVCLLVLY